MNDENENDKIALYTWRLYKKLSHENFSSAEESHKKAVDYYNANDQALNNRVFWFAGIALSILPITVNSVQIMPLGISDKIFFVTFVSLLLISMILGLINHFIEAKFWRDSSQKYFKNMQNWDTVKTKSQDPTHIPIEEFEKCVSFQEGLFFNSKQHTDTTVQTLQIITALVGFTLEVIYILIKLI